MDAVGFACTALFIPLLLVIAASALAVGAAGTIATFRQRRAIRFAFAAILIFGFGVAVYVGRSFVPKEFWLRFRPSYQLTDRELVPYLYVIERFGTRNQGFTPIASDAQVKILLDQEGYVSCPDVELYIPDLPFKRKHICLENVGGHLIWFSQYEVYLGPERWDTLWIALSSIPNVLGHPDTDVYELVIEYRGPEDPRYSFSSLTLDKVRPIISAWHEYHLRVSGSP